MVNDSLNPITREIPLTNGGVTLVDAEVKWLGTHDIGANPGIAWLDLAKAVLDAAQVKYE